MATKKVAFGNKPTHQPKVPKEPDSWVSRRHEEPMKRLTLDIPASLHAEIKSQCAQRGHKIVDELRALLQEKYGKS